MDSNNSNSSSTTVWVVLYGFDDGTGVSVHRTHEAALAARDADVEASCDDPDQLESYNDSYYSDGLTDPASGLWWAVEERELS